MIIMSDTLNHEIVLEALPDSKEEAKSMKEIAQAIGISTSTYSDWIRAERRLSRSLRALIKWGWVACDRRKKDNGHRFWYNAYWKTEMARGTKVGLSVYTDDHVSDMD